MGHSFGGSNLLYLAANRESLAMPILQNVLDHGDSKQHLLHTLLAVPRADLVIAMDDSRTTLLFSLLVRGKQKTGWVQGVSLLYAEGGFFPWKSVRPWVSALVKRVYRPGRIRLPEDKHDAEVELELLDLHGEGRPLAQYRGRYAHPPAMPADRPYIYCAAEARWSVISSTSCELLCCVWPLTLSRLVPSLSSKVSVWSRR